MTFRNWIINKFRQSEDFNSFLKIFNEKNITRLGGMVNSSKALFLSLLLENIDNSILFITRNETDAEILYNDLESFGIEKAFYFPSEENIPYQGALIDESINSSRLEILKNLINNEKCIVTASLQSLLFNIIPKQEFLKYLIKINKNDTINIEDLAKKLIHSGYTRVSKVSSFGEFSIRGEIVDIYYSSDKHPVRLDFNFDIIEVIKTFNPGNQNSENEIDSILVKPFKEFVYNEELIEKAKKILYKLEGDESEKDRIYEKIHNHEIFEGQNFYLNLFYEKASIMEYFKDGVLVVDDIKFLSKQESIFYKEYEDNYHSIAYRNIPKIKPENILFALKEIYSQAYKIIEFNLFEDEKRVFDINFNFKDIPVYLGNLEEFKKDIKTFLEKEYRIVLFANTDIQSERLKDIFKELITNDDKFDFYEKGFSIFSMHLAMGFISVNEKIFFLNDHEVFGKKSKINKHYYSKRTEVIESFIDLKPGDYIVHINHGIGRFTGIERVKSFNFEKDYIAVLYADNDKIFIPVEQLNYIQKYISDEFGKPKLDRIGSKGWSKTKERVKKSIEELARDLIKVYSYRLSQKGFAYLSDSEWQKEFEAKFPYEETRDQLITLEEVKKDMESSRPMDRLICGDVGFGKTEIALRSSFKAVMNGKQVIILVPTTILAEQHYETFSSRLKGYPIVIDMLSRFRNEKEQESIIKNLKSGQIDIIIGTHRLLSNDVSFKNPGLFIIDEEHIFGVKHKEKLKKLRLSMDCLSMTATPIPRTLHMSLSKIRDISIINTPPENRQSVETYVLQFNEEIFKDAVKRELERKGQIFFLHNRIKTIHTMKKYLETLVPKSRIVIAHGQMDGDKLEDIIHSFLKYEYDILLSTTIIESGIDMPRVNTIFIDRADKFGLAQLYQLKGRVGRSNVKAYAYLFYSPDISLTEDAMKRLKVISEYTDLGSGFKIAMKDLEIRGAGNLFGPEQHGDILAVGFHLYCKLLNEALNELAPEDSDDFKKNTGEIYLELQYNGFIPDIYIFDQKQKMEFYKKIAGIMYKEEIDEIEKSLIDRFGPIPDEVKPLFDLALIRILCREMGINEIIEKNNLFEIKFSKFSDLDINKVMNLISSSNGKIYLKSNSPNSIFIGMNEDELLDLKGKGEYIKQVLSLIKSAV